MIQFKTMKCLLMIIVQLAILLVFTNAEDPQLLNLDEIVNFSLEPNVSKTYKAIINKQIKDQTKLYITAQSQFNDPYELPTMTITSDKQFKQMCYNAAAEFTDICTVPTKQLSNGRQFIIEIKCMVSCKLELSAYLSQVLKLELGQQVIITSMEQFGVPIDIEIQIPQSTSFTQILIEANILNIDEVNQGLKLNVNYGQFNGTDFPTMDVYSIKGEATWSDGLGLSLGKDTVKPGEYIKIFLYVTEKMKVRFSTQVVDGTDYNIDLNQQRLELITQGQGRTYNLNLTSYLDEIKDENVDVFVDIYSGDPDIIISFDKSFPSDKIISNDYVSGTINCLLTPQLRQKFNFTGMIYIKIESFWTASYKIYVWLNRKQFIPLKLATTNINQLFKGGVKNYIYEENLFKAHNDTTKSTVLSYVLKIQMMNGNAIFGLRRCKSFENNYSLDCLIKEPKQLDMPQNEKQFKQMEGQVVKSWTTYEVRFKYDFAKCPSSNSTIGVTYECVFQVVGADDNELLSDSTTYAITIYKREISIALKEGQIVKDTVEKEAYHYYMFTLPKLENVSEVGFFLTTIQGDTLMLGSVDDEYPALIDLGSKNISYSIHDVLIFSNLTEKVFYISVYGYEKSDYTLTTVVKRYNKDKQQKENQKTITAINLIQNVIQQYTINKGYQSLLFSFHPTPNVTAKVSVVKKQGNIVYKVQKLVLENKNTVVVPVICQKQGDSCEFNTTQDAQEYQIVVSGNASEIKIFTIGYSYPSLNRCSYNLMNTPIMLTVDKDKSQCLTFSLKQPKQLQILISVSSMQLIEGRILATLKLGDKILIIQQNTKKISVDQVEKSCKKQQKFTPCQMIIQFKAVLENSGFFVVVEEVGYEMILFDGIPQKVSMVVPTIQKAMYFHYQLYFENIGAKIYFSTQPTQKYTIITKIINQTDFLTTNISVLLPFNTAEGPLISKRETAGEVTIMKITKADVASANCKQCMIVISVFKTEGLEKDRMKFKIEATQLGSHLNVGDSKIGFVEEGQIYQYSVSTKDISGGIISVNSIHNDNCVGVFLDPKSTNADNSVYKSYVSLNEKDKHYKIYVKGYKQCSYQISYSSNDKPIHEIILSLPYTITVLNSSTQYLLYYHETNQTFKLIENVISGDSGIFVRPLKQNQQLSTAMQEKLESFPFGDINGSFSDVAVNKNNDKFCFKCFYLIGIRGLPNFKGEVIVLPEGKLIPLKQNSILNDKIKLQDKPKQYVYHSINTFNITIGILFGSVKVVMKSPGGNNVVEEIVGSTKSFSIKHPKEAEDNFIDLFDDKSKFTLTITPTIESGYYILITKHNVSQRLKEGLPTLVEITNTKQTQLQFINYNEAKTISVLIEALNTQLLIPNSLTIQVQLQSEDNSKKQQPSNVVKKILQSQNSYNIEMDSYQSVYIIKIKSITMAKLNISIMVVRNKLTHLISSHDNLFSHEGVFEIYHGNQAVMIEIFNCRGQVEVDASSNYSLLEDNLMHEGEIVMDKVNIGGHYVIGIEGGQGEYFLKTINQNRHKKNQQLLYLISYYMYQSKQIIPYKKITTENDKITPSIGDKSRIFTFKPVLVKESYVEKFNLKSIEYQLIISADELSIQQYSQCCMGQVHIEKINVSQEFQLNPVFKLDTQTINQIIGPSAKQFYVGAIALIQLQDSNLPANYPTHLKYIYDYTQVSIAAEILPIEKQSKTYFIWIVLPFLLASLFLMLSCRYCIKRIYSSYAPTAFVDEQGFGPTDDTLKN